MRTSTLILTLLIVFVLTTAITSGKREKDLRIASLTIQFDKTDAIFIVNYNFDKLPRIYLLIFGSKTLEPKVKSIFPNFDYEIIKIDQDKAILRVKHISRLEKNYYLHDSKKFGDTIGTVYISDTSRTRIREYHNVTATPYYFYKS